MYSLTAANDKILKKLEACIAPAATPHLQRLQRHLANEILLTRRNKTISKYSTTCMVVHHTRLCLKKRVNFGKLQFQQAPTNFDNFR